MRKELRPYQQETVSAVFNKLERGVTRQMIVLATGLGKTVCLVNIISQFKKTLWITHTEELINQSKGVVVNELFDGDDSRVGVIKAERFELDKPVVIASIQTLHRRLDRISKGEFDCIVIDEVHLAMASGFRKALDHFSFKLFIGATATPYRLDGASLTDIIDEIAIEKDIKWGIDNKFLCEIDAIRIKTTISLDGVKTVMGDLSQKDLRVIDNPVRNNLAVQKYKEYASDRKAVAYCIDVEHAINLAQAFNDAGVPSTFVVGDTSLCPDREDRIAGLRNGKYKVLTNVNILTTGYDYPELGCMIMARPTKSKTLYVQAIGRGLRLKQNLKDCILLDLVDVSSRHQLINSLTLDEGKELEDKVFITREKKEQIRIEKEKKRLEHELNKDERVNLLPLPKVVVKYMKRITKEPSEKQLAWIAREGYDVANNSYTMGQIMEIISSFPARSFDIEYLKKHGYNTKNGVTVGEFGLAKKEIEEKIAQGRLKFVTKSPFKGVR